jgi:hypothetical protein
MPFSESVKVMLYASSGNRCAFPGCATKLVFTEEKSKALVNHGKAAHIVAESRKGPRGRSPLSIARRNSFENGLILCTNHHTDVVDKYPSKFSVSQLRQWKKAHERKYARSSDSRQRHLDVIRIYAEFIDQWSELAYLNAWYNWTAPLLRAGSSCLSSTVYQSYIELCSWIAARVWPGKIQPLEDAIQNFGRVAVDFIFTFDRHSEAHGEMYCTEKFYKQLPARQWDERQKAIARFQFHVGLVEDLTVELTRAANLVCQRVRETIDADFRRDEGHLMIETGMYEDMSYRRHVVRYRKSELKRSPYPGIARFMKARNKRDFHLGSGADPEYLKPDSNS